MQRFAPPLLRLPRALQWPAGATLGLIAFALLLAALAAALRDAAPPPPLPRFAFTSDQGGSIDLYVSAADGGLPLRLTEDAAFDGDPAWSPDRSRIIFASEQDGNVDLYVVDVDGGAVERLTDDPAPDLHPAWSPDGKKIAFTADRFDEYEHDYDGNAEIVVLDLETRGLTRITHDPADDAFPAWSPDGQRIVFASQRSGNYNLYIVPATGGDPRQITFETGTSWQPVWSPDGTRIAFTYVPTGFVWDQVAWISLVDPDGGNLVRVTREFRGDFDPDWSPDGSRLVFVSTRDGQRALYTMGLAGDAVERVLTGEGLASDPAWQP